MGAGGTLQQNQVDRRGDTRRTPQHTRTRTRRVSRHTALASALGLASLSAAAASFVTGETRAPLVHDGALAAALAGGALLLQTFHLVFPWRGRSVHVPLEAAAVFVGLAILTPTVAVLVLAATTTLGYCLRARSLRRAAPPAAVEIAGLAAAGLAGAHVTPLLTPLLGALGGTIAYAVVRNATCHLTRVRRTSSRAARETLLASSILQFAVGASVGTAVLALWRLHPLALLTLLPITLLARGYARLRAANARRAQARQRLAAVARLLGDELDEAAAIHGLIDSCAKLFDATTVAVTLHTTPPRTWTRIVTPSAAPQRTLDAQLTGRDGAHRGRIVVQVDARGRSKHDDEQVMAAVASEAASLLDHARLFEAQKRARAQAEAAVASHRASLAALARSEARLQSIIAHSPAAIFLKDLEGRYVLVNRRAEEVLGVSAEALLGRTDREAFPPATAARLEADAHEALARRGLVERELRMGEGLHERSFISFLFPIADNDGSIHSVCGIATDITERKLAQAALDAARTELAANEKLSALGSLVSGVAHEIRTPLTYMGNHLFIARRRLQKVQQEHPELQSALDEIARLLAEAEHGGDRVNHLVRDLRRFTQLRPEERVTAGLQEVVAEAVRLFEATHRGRAHLEADLAPTPFVRVDRVQIQQVVLNLLGNAADAMPNGGRLCVRTRATDDGGSVELVVEDEGGGIPPHVQPHVFEPFYTTKTDGTGLGLSITRRIVEAHGGRIRFDTRADEGTRFVVRLPVTPRATAVAAT